MPIDLADPIAVALAAAAAFDTAGLPVALYGGLALATYGNPRETVDADLACANVSVEAGHAALEAAGIDSTIAFRAVRFGGLSIGRLTLVGGGKLNMVDLVTPISPRFAEGVMTRTLRGTLDDQAIRVVGPEDFVLLKILSTREKDLDDAATVIVSLYGRLDDELLGREVEALANEIPDHDVRGRYQRVLTTTA